MSLFIKIVDKNNYKELINLKVTKEQENFIETVETCLKEAREYSVWKPVGIYDGAKPIGFAMYGLFLDEGENGRVWLDRFLISYKEQGKGYGKAGIKLLINNLYEEYGYDEIYLSVYKSNDKAIKLYKDLGFQFNDEVDVNGEKIMVINLNEKGRDND
ncbi:GNAT family N-acetyltransferase [Clostridium tarantellae]|uniref:GNAT family N-acetyltransferase n=1 Tax=Clostridium tarantellae TaxID=39493 RepID=A0A6I1MM59_9CLOT|nr:GNAT family N-acetyltransferase [Clostridium tarantellae]MPQ43528.1 GNAT family N-acetyltransferase [Clostridium tarantellae]